MTQVTLQEQFNDFGAIGRLERSGQLERALEEPDFVTKAIRLLRIRDKVNFASSKNYSAVGIAAEEEGKRRAKTPGRIALGIGFALGAGAVAIAGGGIFVMAAAGALAATMVSGAVRSFRKFSAEMEGEEIQSKGYSKVSEMRDRIDSALQRMEDQLSQQPPEVREGYQAAFRHAEQRRKTGSASDMPMELLDAEEEITSAKPQAVKHKLEL